MSLAGCTSAPGEPFAALSPSFSHAWSRPADRELGGGWQKLASEYQVRLTRAELELAPIELRDFGEVDLGSFDPANPPEGYSLCHGGHCHRDDGALVSYEEIAASESGGRPPAVVATLPLSTVDLLAPDERPLQCDPSCDLPLAHVRQARTAIRAIALEGTVRDGLQPPRLSETPFRYVVTFEPDAPAILGPLDLPADRRHPPYVTLQLALEPGPSLLDKVDWASPGSAAPLDLAANAEASEAMKERLKEIPLHAQIERRDQPDEEKSP